MKATVKAVTVAVLVACSGSALSNTYGSDATASPVLTWNQIALSAVERAKPTQHQVVRLMANLSLAQHAAVVMAGQDANAARDAVAVASSQVIAALLPSQAAFAASTYEAMRRADSPLGRRIADRVISEAHADRFASAWTGGAPQAAYAWRSLATPPGPPAYPAIGGMRMLMSGAVTELRASAPPMPGSREFLDDLAEVRLHSASPTDETVRIAKFYDMTTGTMAGGFWNEEASRLIRDSNMNDARATTVLAAVNSAMMDALVACHDTKYTYWVPRPSQVDSSIKPVIGVPNHPSYPSNHSCLSTAAAHVLAHFFPSAREALLNYGVEAGLSRIYAGIHYRFDVVAGEDIGRKVAAMTIARHADVLARNAAPLVQASR